MALHSAQGPRLGLPQMISSRAQFGVYGAIVPLVLVIVMYLGFTATGTVLAGQAINELLRIDNADGRHRAVRRDRRRDRDRRLPLDPRRRPGRERPRRRSGWPTSPIQLVPQHDVSAAFAGNQFDVVTFLLAVSLAAGWQLTYGPYVADYSRYLPATTSRALGLLVDLRRQRARLAALDDLRRDRRRRSPVTPS